MNTPVWLLDVDGVINANRPGWSAAPKSRGVALSNGLYAKVKWEPRLISVIRGLHFSGSVDIRWATSWVSYSPELEGLLLLPPLPLAFTDAVYAGLTKAKIDAALHVVEVDKRPLIWTDDEVIDALDADTRDRLVNSGVPTLLISPKSNRGLRPDDVDAITAFIADCGGTD